MLFVDLEKPKVRSRANITSIKKKECTFVLPAVSLCFLRIQNLSRVPVGPPSMMLQQRVMSKSEKIEDSECLEAKFLAKIAGPTWDTFLKTGQSQRGFATA